MLPLQSLVPVLAILIFMGPASSVQDPALELAQAQFQSGDLAAAARQCRTILSHQPDHLDALHLLGKISFIAAKSLQNFPQSLQAYGEAERAFLRLLQMAPERDETRIEQSLAVCAQKRGAALEALARARNATNLGPKKPNAFRILGECASDLGRTDEAIRALQTSLELDPGNVDVIWLLAREFQTAKKPHKAIAILEQAITDKPKDSKSLAILYQLLYENHLASNDSTRALTAIENVVRVAPQNATGAIEHASTLYRLGRFDEARKAALRTRGLQVADSRILAVIALKLGQILLHDQKYVEAIVELKTSVQHDPADLEALQSLAGVLRRTGQDEEARSILKMYREVRSATTSLETNQAIYRAQPEHRAAQENIIRALITLSRFEEAEKQLELRQRKFPRDPRQDELLRLLTESKSK